MNAFPIAVSADEALSPERPLARTALEAARKAGGPVYLAQAELDGVYSTIAEAEAARPDVYGDPRFELIWREGWRVVIRFWRPAPAAPVGRTPVIAARRPLGYASTPEEARAILGAPAERVAEPLGPAYSTRARAMARARPLLDEGHAEIAEREGRFVILLTFWRPLALRLSPAERAELADRAAAPLRAQSPQASPYIGLFERLAPENPAIVLVADEGDGRSTGE